MRKDDGESSKGAVFLDRDGTLIEDNGYLSNVRDIYIFPETIEALRKLQERYVLFIVSNQTGVSKGLITMDDVNRINRYLEDIFLRNGVYIKEWYTCPHAREENCRCIKPNPYFLQKAAGDYRISLPHSYVIGDHPHDVHTGDNAGATGLYVCTGHGKKHRDGLGPDTTVFENIGKAAEWILESSGK